MTSRYNNKEKYINSDDRYQEWFDAYGVEFIEQYKVEELKYPTNAEISRLETVAHIWSNGDNLSKLSDYYYNDYKKWWIIAQFNMRPTDAQYRIGDIVYIPFPLERIMEYLDV
jgi:hypothetical protein